MLETGLCIRWTLNHCRIVSRDLNRLGFVDVLWYSVTN